MTDFIADLYRRQPLLILGAALNVGLILVMLAGLLIDQRTILGLNPWVKPIKFAISIATYFVTIALFISYLPSALTGVRQCAVIIFATLMLEIVLISLQSLRGVPSHFNTGTFLDGAVFTAMGIAIAINTVAVGVILVHYFASPPALAQPYLWGIRFGLAAFMLGSLQGFMMASRMAHAVGVPDGGPGLPFLNWSTTGGDLRVAHFIGLHALQIVPLVGYLLSPKNPTAPSGALPLLSVWGVGGAVIGLMVWATLHALAGRTFFSLK